MYGLFYRMAMALYKWVCIRRFPFPANRQVELDLERLHPGENKKQICTEYYVNKLAKSMMICAIALILGMAVAVQAKGNEVLNESGELVRGAYGEDAKSVEVECVLPDKARVFQVTVNPRSYGEDAIAELYEEFRERLPDFMLGSNVSLEEVAEDLCLYDSYEDYPFLVEWESDNPDRVSSSGKVVQGEETADVRLTALISYEKWEWRAEFPVRIMPVVLTEEERIHGQIEALLQQSEQDSRTQERWKLPESWQGSPILWKEKTSNNSIWVWVGGGIVALLVYVMADKDLHDSVEQRKQQMLREYPDVVHKLTLYLGAGMTIRWSFQKIAGEYEEAQKKGGKENAIYEEMVHICRELKAGVSEGAAYEHFGRRTGLQEYIRLSTLLTQNLKKGNSMLLQRLREETEKASIERIQYSKRLGEEAVTKLLLPMVLMLLVVMLMIMIPAFSSMGN